MNWADKFYHVLGSDEVSKRVYIVLSVILYMTWLTISALCGSYHDVLALFSISLVTHPKPQSRDHTKTSLYIA